MVRFVGIEYGAFKRRGRWEHSHQSKIEKIKRKEKKREAVEKRLLWRRACGQPTGASQFPAQDLPRDGKSLLHILDNRREK
jgi:hypothetical protein